MTAHFEAPVDGAWTLTQLLAAEEDGHEPEFLCFWGHKPPTSGQIGPHVLSQWYLHDFEADGARYRTAEHFMMAEKAKLFGDDEHHAAILDAASPRQAKALGRRVRGFDDATWTAHRDNIVTRASLAKFGSDEQLRSYLVGTGTKVLVEASPRDRIWGIGLAQTRPSARQPSRWRGENLLGFALMRTRAQLR